jgi:hypothetical protein
MYFVRAVEESVYHPNSFQNEIFFTKLTFNTVQRRYQCVDHDQAFQVNPDLYPGFS